MANIKKVHITGCVPFNVHEYDGILPYLAYMAGPVSGLQISYSHVTKIVPNDDGGRTAYYAFRIHGVDSVSHNWLNGLIERISETGGSTYKVSVSEVDG